MLVKVLRGYLIVLVIFSCLSLVLFGYFQFHSSDDEGTIQRRKRLTKEKTTMSLINMYSERAITTSFKKLANGDFVFGETRRVTWRSRLGESAALNEFLAYVVDVVSGSYDTIVPLTSIRMLTDQDMNRMGMPVADTNRIAVLVEKPGGIRQVNTNACSTYQCSTEVYDPLIGDEMCELIIDDDPRKPIFPREQLDHLYVLDYILLGGATSSRQSFCTFVPNRSREGSDVLIAINYYESCCCASANDEEEADPLPDKACFLHMKTVERFSPFWSKSMSYRGKSLGTLVGEFLHRNSLPQAIKQVTAKNSECLSRFYLKIDQRLERLLSWMERKCPEREEMAY